MKQLNVVRLVALCVLLLAGCGSEGDAAKVYGRDELSGLVVGKSLDDLRKTLGPPHKVEVSGDNPDRGYFEYLKRTRDGKGNVDPQVFIWYNKGRVTEVTW